MESINKTDNKYIFGAYVNMARQNFVHTLSIILKKCKIPITDENNITLLEDALRKLFDPNHPINNLQKIIDRFLPWINPVALGLAVVKKTRGDGRNTNIAHTVNNDEIYNWLDVYREIIIKTHVNLDKLRNQYSHYDSEFGAFESINISINASPYGPHEKQIEIIEFLNTIYDSSINIIKERFKADEHAIKHLRRYKSVGRQKPTLRRYDDIIDPFNYQFCFTEDQSELNIPSSAFFICQFLEKKYAYIFLKKLKNFKRSDDIKYRMTFEVFVAHSIHIPKDRLESEGDNKLMMAMDMINDLSKVPITLMETLSGEDQRKFRNFDEAANDL